MKKRLLFLIIVFLIGFKSQDNFCLAQSKQDSEQRVENGKVVSIEYRARLADGTVVDSNIGKPPLTYNQGKGQIIPGLERQLLGLKVGEAKKVGVSPKEAYGEYDVSAVQEIPKKTINIEDLSVGAKLYSRDSYGRMATAVVKEIKKDTVVLDMNHPLAGKTLYFDVKILDIK